MSQANNVSQISPVNRSNNDHTADADEPITAADVGSFEMVEGEVVFKSNRPKSSGAGDSLQSRVSDALGVLSSPGASSWFGTANYYTQSAQFDILGLDLQTLNFLNGVQPVGGAFQALLTHTIAASTDGGTEGLMAWLSDPSSDVVLDMVESYIDLRIQSDPSLTESERQSLLEAGAGVSKLRQGEEPDKSELIALRAVVQSSWDIASIEMGADAYAGLAKTVSSDMDYLKSKF